MVLVTHSKRKHGLANPIADIHERLRLQPRIKAFTGLPSPLFGEVRSAPIFTEKMAFFVGRFWVFLKSANALNNMQRKKPIRKKTKN